MVYQYAETALVLKFDAPGLEFSVSTMGPDATLLRASSLPGWRLGPLFQFIEPFARPRQLMIDVTPARPVDRAAIRLEVSQFEAANPNYGILTRAYQLLSAGTETVHSSDTSTWVAKSGALRGAADIFGSLGMEEMRLWSNYLAAVIVLNQLRDPLTASELADEIGSAAARAGLQQVELAAVVLAGDAQFELAMTPAAAGQGAANLAGTAGFAAAMAALDLAAEQSQAQGVPVESGRAVYREGLLLERAGAPEQALQHYDAALTLVLSGGDVELANEIRGTSAALHESLGRTSGALALIDNITEDLAESTTGDVDAELAAGLFEKGRLLNLAYRYSEAVPELSRALELQRAGSESWTATALELGWSLFALGDLERAASALEAGLRRVSGTLDRALLARSFGALASVRRQQGRFVEAERAREQQGARLGQGPGRAQFLFESAMDLRLRDGPGSAAAQSLLSQAARRAQDEGDSPTLHQARIWLCLLQSEQAGPGACGPATSMAELQALEAAAIPAFLADAMLVQARVLALAGRRLEGREQLQSLIYDLYWLRSTLPGVLGPWYPEHRERLFQDYLDLARPDGTGDGRPLLLASEQLRLLEAADHARPAEQLLAADEADAIRSLLARSELAREPEARLLAAELRAGLARLEREVKPPAPMIDDAELGQLLSRLQASEAVLRFHLDGRRSLALLGRSRNVQALALPGASTALDRLLELRSLLGRPAAADLAAVMKSLGQDLFGPLQAALPEVVFVLPSGPLRGVPLDALPVDGVPLLERHLLIGLHGLRSLALGLPQLPADWHDRVFAAGNPQNQGDPFSLDLAVSPDLAAVADRFVGPGLQVVQGAALQPGEFASGPVRQAALLHLALPGTIDLGEPERSQLRLSAGPNELAGSYLAPRDVRGLQLDAPLIVLTATVCAGDGEPGWASRVAFADDFAEAGAAAVLFSLWVQPEAVRLAFVSELYSALESDPDIAAAVAAAKRAALRSEDREKLGSWAGFQLFIR